MVPGELRIGIIGAGMVARERHIPGFRAIEGVKIVAVCNQRRESTIRVAREFDIPKIVEDWEHLVEDPEVDAVVIGTHPSMHCPVTLGALDAGKHVLTQSRMAMNAREAQRMLDRAVECPRLVTMVAPTALGLAGDATVRKLIADGFLGILHEAHVRGLNDTLADPTQVMGWRQMTKYVGFNMLNLGELHETVLRWVAAPVRVLAKATKLVAIRRDPETGKRARVGTADSIQALTTHEDGSLGIYSLSGVTRNGGGNSVALHGAAGTIFYDLDRDEIRAARAGHPGLTPLTIPASLRGSWRVEAEFVDAIREGKPVTRNDFATGVRTMQFTEAVARSSRHQQPIDLPLTEFSNPSL